MLLLARSQHTCASIEMMQTRRAKHLCTVLYQPAEWTEGCWDEVALALRISFGPVLALHDVQASPQGTHCPPRTLFLGDTSPKPVPVQVVMTQ